MRLHLKLCMRWGSASIILLLILGLIYAASLPGDFHFDDYLLLLDNPDVNSSTFRYSSFLDHYGGRPLTLLSFSLNFQLGGRLATSYVVLNIGLHLLVCFLLFRWIGEVSGQLWQGFGTALLFGLHPLQTQAVNYIWSRSMLLMSCFALAALWAARRRPGWLSLGLFQLAIWSRTDAMAIAPFLVAQGIRLQSVILLLLVNLGGFLVGLYRHAPTGTAWQHSDMLGYWFAQPAAVLEYLRMMLIPLGLSIDHHFRPSNLYAITATLILAGVLILALRYWEKTRLESWAGAWVLLLLAPSALIPNEDVFNESRAYLALAGFAFVATSLVLRHCTAGAMARSWRVAVATALLLLASLSIVRNRLWNDNLALWQTAAERYPAKLRIQYNLGHAYLLEDRISPAEAAFRRALGLNPKDDLSYAALGYCAEVKGDWAEARVFYTRALELNHRNGYAVRGLERADRELGGTGRRPELEERR